jgi:phosphatidyl-myo-inositol dimannoside synthase
VLVVSNDFPPRIGGVQQYVWNLVEHLPSQSIAVLAPAWPGWRDHDDRLSYPVHRWPARGLWPTGDLVRRVRSLVREHDADVVLFGHGLLTLIGPRLRSFGIPYVGLTHGWEVWLARTPGLAGPLRRGLVGASAVTAVSRYTARAIHSSLRLPRPLIILHPGVDPARFSPAADGAAVRARHDLEDRPVILCVSRLVPRKGQDVLIRGMEVVHRLAPGAGLLIVGDGPDRGRLEALGAGSPPGTVSFAGQVSDAELPAHYAACDVFAMPCRSRWGGLEVEGFGIVYLEAGATGKPVVAGRSGGAAEAVEDGRTGILVEAGEPKAVGLSVSRLIMDGDRALRMGAAGRARVEARFTWRRQASALLDLLRQAAD